jgi:hypothetical protein
LDLDNLWKLKNRRGTLASVFLSDLHMGVQCRAGRYRMSCHRAMPLPHATPLATSRRPTTRPVPSRSHSPSRNGSAALLLSSFPMSNGAAGSILLCQSKATGEVFLSCRAQQIWCRGRSLMTSPFVQVLHRERCHQYRTLSHCHCRRPRPVRTLSDPSSPPVEPCLAFLSLPQSFFRRAGSKGSITDITSISLP